MLANETHSTEALQTDLKRAQKTAENTHAMYQAALIAKDKDRVEFEMNNEEANLVVARISVEIEKLKFEEQLLKQPRDDMFLAACKESLLDSKKQRDLQQAKVDRLALRSSSPVRCWWCFMRMCSCCV